MAIHYVDSSVSTSGNGSSWATAWKNLTNITGLLGGDIVYISGGPTGSSQTYVLSTPWVPTSGSTGARITYQIGQDSLHNGTAIFSCGSNLISSACAHIIFTGDAGDGLMHFLISSAGATLLDLTGNATQDLRFAYINCPQSSNLTNNFWGVNGGSGLEIDHCLYYKQTSASSNSLGYFFSNGPWAYPFDDSKIHDNILYVPHSTTTSGFGDDCMGGNPASGISIYNNVVHSYGISNYLSGQHQDGFQPLSGFNLKVYNNTYYDIGNYGTFGDAYSGNFTDFYIYNNLYVIADPVVQAYLGPAAVAVGVDGGSSGAVLTRVIIANNLADGYQAHQSYTLNNVTSHSGQFVGCIVANNINVNGSVGVLTQGNTTSQVVDNPVMNVAAGQAAFVSYAANSYTNNYHLKSNATNLIGQGLNLSQYFTTDREGNPRPSGGNWDIGPYAFTTGGGGFGCRFKLL